MQIAQIVSSRDSEKYGSSAEPGIQLPAAVAASVAAAPISDASTTCPLRILYMYRPIKSAIGTVQAIVNVPQELPATNCFAPAGSVTWLPRCWNTSCGLSLASAGWSTATENSSLRATVAPPA